jgi:hypothetical protein
LAKVTGAGYFTGAAPSDDTEVFVKWKTARVDVADNSTTVYAGPCRIGKIYVDTVLSAHACPIKDNTTTIGSLVASLAAGSTVTAFEGTVCDSSLVIDPNDAATGMLVIQYAPL